MTDPKPETDDSVDPEIPYNIMDGATGEMQAVAQQVDAQRKIASDRTLSVDKRLEAYEDIIDSEVGDTSLMRARNIEREIGFRQLYLKFEGGNPSGTQKDRIAFAQAADAMRRGFEMMTVATCGNYGVAVAMAASLAGLGCLIYIPESYHTRRIAEMEALGPRIVRVAGDYEAAVNVSRRQGAENEYYDANPGGDNTVLQLSAYGGIAYEIYDDLRDAPAVVAVPVSNGTTLAGIYKGFLSLYRRGKTSRMPRIVAGSSFRKNPIVHAFVANSSHCKDLNPQQIRETSVNEPLVNWHSIDGNHALEAIRQTGGWASDASDKTMRTFSKIIRDREGLQVLPASTAGLVALVDQHTKGLLPSDRYVVVLTGRRS